MKKILNGRLKSRPRILSCMVGEADSFLHKAALLDRRSGFASPNPSADGEGGQALVEMIISLTILMLVLMGITSAITFGLAAVSETSLNGQSVHLAQEGIERARVQRDQNWSGIVDNCCSSDGSVIAGTAFSRTIQVSDTSPDEKQIKIDVSWTSRGIARTTTLVTVLTRWSN